MESHPYLCCILYPQGSALYNRAVRSLLLAYAIIQLVHYLVCFTLLLIIYYKLLKYIRNLRRDNGQFNTLHPLQARAVP